MAGYSIELVLKWKFCDKLKIDFPKKLDDINIKTHNLESLVKLCGEESNLNQDGDWGVIVNLINWNEQLRYNSKSSTLEDASMMVNSCNKLLKTLKLII